MRLLRIHAKNAMKNPKADKYTRIRGLFYIFVS